MIKSDVCIITTCKGRLEHLKQSVKNFVENTDADVMVVDCSCPEDSGNIIKSIYPDVIVERIIMDTWNPSLARNAGAIEARWLGYKYFVFMDADCLITKPFWDVLKTTFVENSFTFISPNCKELIGFIAVPADLFFSVGMYDLDFFKYGHEDIYLRLMLYQECQKYKAITPVGVSTIQHSDELRVKFSAVKEESLISQLNETIMLLYNKFCKKTGLELVGLINNENGIYKTLMGNDHIVATNADS